MATAENGEARSERDDAARPSWACAATWSAAVSEAEEEAWRELEARLRLKGSVKEGK